MWLANVHLIQGHLTEIETILSQSNPVVDENTSFFLVPRRFLESELLLRQHKADAALAIIEALF